MREAELSTTGKEALEVLRTAFKNGSLTALPLIIVGVEQNNIFAPEVITSRVRISRLISWKEGDVDKSVNIDDSLASFITYRLARTLAADMLYTQRYMDWGQTALKDLATITDDEEEVLVVLESNTLAWSGWSSATWNNYRAIIDVEWISLSYQ